MSPEYCKFAVIISKIPVMQSGLSTIMETHFPDYELNFCQSLEELTLLQLRRTDVVIVDFSGRSDTLARFANNTTRCCPNIVIFTGSS